MCVCVCMYIRSGSHLNIHTFSLLVKIRLSVLSVENHYKNYFPY